MSNRIRSENISNEISIAGKKQSGVAAADNGGSLRDRWSVLFETARNPASATSADGGGRGGIRERMELRGVLHLHGARVSFLLYFLSEFDSEMTVCS